jgi:hypothetical protein
VKKAQYLNLASSVNFRNKECDCKICGFQGGDYEECRLLGCDAVWFFKLLVTANVPSWLILSTPMTVAIRSSETSVLTKAKRRHLRTRLSSKNVNSGSISPSMTLQHPAAKVNPV